MSTGRVWKCDSISRSHRRPATQTLRAAQSGAGYDPVYTEPLGNAPAQESLIGTIFAISRGIGPFVHRIAPPDQL
jgi:hypothetical protein